MRALVIVCLALVLAAAPRPADAQEADALRRELEQLRRQFEAVQQEYQKALQSLSERLQRVEARPATAAAPPAVVQAPAGPTPAGPPSLRDLAQPRQPFALSQQRTPGALLFDIGVAGDFVANFVQRNVDKANVGTFDGRENRFFPREIELSLFGQVDPYARGELRIEAAEEFEDGAREIHVGLAEAHLTLLTLPLDTQLKLGLMRPRFGLLNPIHAHDLPQVDRPNALVRFFGDEQLVESGGEVSWVAPLPVYLELVAGIFNGDNEESFGRATLKEPLVTGRLRTFFELGETTGLQLGVSGATGKSEDRHRTTLAGADVKYKYTPASWRHALLTLAGEALYSTRHVEVLGDPDGDGVETGERRTRARFGWYTYAEVQPWRRWVFGARYDSTQFPVDPGREWAIQPYVTFLPSEFLRFRLGYKHTERSHRVAGEDDRGSGRILDELFLQASFLLGAHPTHPF